MFCKQNLVACKIKLPYPILKINNKHYVLSTFMFIKIFKIFVENWQVLSKRLWINVKFKSEKNFKYQRIQNVLKESGIKFQYFVDKNLLEFCGFPN